jgi:stage IV sporulation protein FB
LVSDELRLFSGRQRSSNFSIVNRANFVYHKKMLRFSLFGIPIVVEWWFLLISALLGGGLNANTPDAWTQVGIWTGIVFVSIVVHELGHAVVGRRFGASPAISLHGFGGTTFLPGGRFTRKESILVSAAGPVAGLVLGLIVLAVDLVTGGESRWARIAVRDALYVNFFWTAINLLPIQPLDGGQILREALGPQRIRITSAVGFVLAAVLCVWAISERMIFSAFMAAMLAYYNISQQPVQGGVVKE